VRLCLYIFLISLIFLAAKLKALWKTETKEFFRSDSSDASEMKLLKWWANSSWSYCFPITVLKVLLDLASNSKIHGSWSELCLVFLKGLFLTWSMSLTLTLNEKPISLRCYELSCFRCMVVS